MNYQYIEQLLDRYFDCITTLEEEQILRSFFNQEDVPAHLMQYRDIFACHTESRKDELGANFDARLLALIQEEQKPARMVPIRNSRFAPFFRAAATVAIILTIGGAAERSMNDHSEDSSTDAITVTPYTKSGDIASMLHRGDIYQAETRPQTDSLPTVTPVENSDNILR